MPNPNMTYEELREQIGKIKLPDVRVYSVHPNMTIKDLVDTSLTEQIIQLFTTLYAEVIPEDKPYIDGTTTYDSLILESNARRILRKEVLARIAQLTQKSTKTAKYNQDDLKPKNTNKEPKMEILQQLYNSEINVCIWWNWDGGVEVRIGNGIYNNEENWEASNTCETVAEAIEWLKTEAIERYPNSVFAKNTEEENV